ncbi:hypothetical protein UPYG_G00230530 [Umbra pygmaea]|uniref:Uncharacterized protein n=1 Tax=Umbra pygmaea TaxID=75934 RepID=A0ABD0X178_UMBPY
MRSLKRPASLEPPDTEGDGLNLGMVKGARVPPATSPSGCVGERPVTTSSPSTSSSTMSTFSSSSSSLEMGSPTNSSTARLVILMLQRHLSSEE